MFKNILNNKIILVVALLYSYLYYYGYQYFLYRIYDYAGFNILSGRTDNFVFLSYTFFLSVSPILLHKGIKKISSFLSVFIYLILYVPIIFTFFFQREASIGYIMYIQFLFFLGMSMLFLVDRISVSHNFYLPLKFDVLKVVLGLTWFGTLYIAYKYNGNLRFSNYEDVYIQRSATSELGKDLFTAYFGAFFANVFIPISSTYGLFAKKKIYFISGAIGSLIFYMATADKAILLFPYIILVLFFFLKNKSLNNTFIVLTLGLCTLEVITLVSGFSIFSALLWMRTIGNGGLLTSLYHDFFQTNPLTYYTNVNFINALTQSYPYGTKGVGQVVGAYYYSSEMNANANFWATDGIASLGDIGILIASIALCFIFYLFNKIMAGYNKLFLVCILVPYITSLLNQSLFSSLLTGGALMVMFILSFKSMLKNPYINENINNSRS